MFLNGKKENKKRPESLILFFTMKSHILAWSDKPYLHSPCKFTFILSIIVKSVKFCVLCDGVQELTVDDGETFPLDRSIDVSDFKL